MDRDRDLYAELHGLHGDAHRPVHAELVARQGVHPLHHHRLVGAVVGLVLRHGPHHRRHGHEHELQGESPAWDPDLEVQVTIYLPSWIPYLLLAAAGLIMQYIWTGWKPQKADAEIIAHAGLYYTGGLNNRYDPSQPQARDDIYLILVSLFSAVETFDFLQRLLRNSILIYLGTRSLSKLSPSEQTRPSVPPLDICNFCYL